MIDLEPYGVTDAFFGAPYIDVDEERDLPVPYRHIHGGFKDTDTRFTFYFPLDGYQGRMFQPLEGGHGGSEGAFGSPALAEILGGLTLCQRLGGYMVESNQGHIGDDLDPKGGEDPTLYGHRASAEAARLSKHVAAQVYGSAPHHSYVWGGSGGGRRSPLCLENAPGVWDGALPFVGGGDVAEPGNTKRVKGAQAVSFATMFNVQRLLAGPKLAAVVDAMAPGGGGDPFVGLDTHERELLAELYRLGFPRGDEFIIGEPMGQMWLWSATADLLAEQDPTYFEKFWTEPGYVGRDLPERVLPDLVDAKLTVDRVYTAQELLDEVFVLPEYSTVHTLIAITAGAAGAMDMPMGIKVSGMGDGYRLGTGVRVLNGKAAGRQLYAIGVAGDVLFCDGLGEANLRRFTDVIAGDEVHVDNRRFLAYCYWARHHVMDDVQFDQYRVDGQPIFPQHEPPFLSPLMGVCYSGQYEGKLMWIHHTHDASLWPPCGLVYKEAVEAAQGPERAREVFRLRWTENAEHGPAMMVPSPPGRASSTWLIDFIPVIEQSLQDLVDWVERGIEPVGTSFEYVDGRVVLPESAAERGGIQPVVSVTANGTNRAEVRVGEEVALDVHAAVPPGAGTVIAVEWDFDGSGRFPFRHVEVDGTAAEVALTTTHSYDRPGTYFATARVVSHVDGKVDATSRRLPNVAQARIIVT
jgi:hypothetical protein